MTSASYRRSRPNPWWLVAAGMGSTVLGWWGAVFFFSSAPSPALTTTAPRPPEPLARVASADVFSSRGLAAFFERLTTANPAELAGLLSSHVDDELAFDIVDHWAKTDRESLIAWFRDAFTQKPAWERHLRLDDLLHRVVRSWSEADPVATYDLVSQWDFLGDSLLATASIALNAAFAKDAEQGLALYLRAGAPDTYIDAPGWVTKAPHAAAALLLRLPVGALRGAILGRIISTWKDTDPAAAVRLLTDFPLATRPFSMTVGDAIRDRQRYQHAALYDAWAKKDLDGLMAYANDEATGHLRAGLLAAAARTLAQRDPVTALDWIAENLSGASRQTATSDAVRELARQDLAAAAAKLSDFSGTALTSSAAGYLAALDGRPSPAQLTDMLHLPQEDLRHALGAELTSRWDEQSAADLRPWLEAQPPEVRQQFIDLIRQGNTPAARQTRVLEKLGLTPPPGAG